MQRFSFDSMDQVNHYRILSTLSILIQHILNKELALFMIVTYKLRKQSEILIDIQAKNQKPQEYVFSIEQKKDKTYRMKRKPVDSKLKSSTDKQNSVVCTHLIIDTVCFSDGYRENLSALSCRANTQFSFLT